MNQNGWNIYIVECKTGDLYVGITKDIDERIRKHNAGQACRYTKFRKPVNLLYTESCDNYNQARKREREVKKFSREKKLSLIQAFETSRSVKAELEVQNFTK